MSCTGKHWITPDGVIDVGTGDFNSSARAFAIGVTECLPFRFIHQPLNAMTEDEYEELREIKGVNKMALLKLYQGMDAKEYCIENEGWIRHCRGHFDLWKVTPGVLNMLKTADKFWENQVMLKDDLIEISEVRDCFDVTVTFENLMKCFTKKHLSERNRTWA